MKKQIKLLCALLCVLLCTSLLLSACLVMHNGTAGLEHDCIGDNCPICQGIFLQRELLKSIMLCCFCGGIVFLLSQLSGFVSLVAGVRIRNSSLVARKVKLSA